MTNQGLASAPPKRRSVAQRYKLQENLRVSPGDDAFARTSTDGMLANGNHPFLPLPPPPACGTGALLSSFHHHYHHHHPVNDGMLLLHSGPPSACSDCSSVDGSGSGSSSGSPSTRSNSALSLANDIQAALSASSSASSSRAGSACGSGSAEDTASSSSPELHTGEDGHDSCLLDFLATTSPFAAKTQLQPSRPLPLVPPPPTTTKLLSCECTGSVSILCTVDSATLTACQEQSDSVAAAAADPEQQLFAVAAQLQSGAAYEGGAGGATADLCYGCCDCGSGGGGGSSVLSRSSSLALSFADFVHRDSLTDPDVLFREVQQQEHAFAAHPADDILYAADSGTAQQQQQHQTTSAGCCDADEAFSFAPMLATSCGVVRCSCEDDGDDDAGIGRWKQERCWSLSATSPEDLATGGSRQQSELEPLAAAADRTCAEQPSQLTVALSCSVDTVTAAAAVAGSRGAESESSSAASATGASGSSQPASAAVARTSDDRGPASGPAPSSSPSPSLPCAAPPCPATAAGVVDLSAVDSAVQMLKQLRGSLLKAGTCPATRAASTAASAAGGCTAIVGARQVAPPPLSRAAAPGAIGASLAQAAQSLAGLGLLPPQPPVGGGRAAPAVAPTQVAGELTGSRCKALLRRMKTDWARVHEQIGGVVEDYTSLAKHVAATVAKQVALERRCVAAEEGKAALVCQLQAEREGREELARQLQAERAARAALQQQLEEQERQLVAEVRERAAEGASVHGEMDELLLCLGQESSKVAALAGALRAAGGDAEGIIEQVECEFAAKEAGAA